MKRISPMDKQAWGILSARRHRLEIRRQVWRKAVKSNPYLRRLKNKIQKRLISVPSEFSLSTNYENTVRSLVELKDIACAQQTRGQNSNPQIGIALERIRDLQPAAALVLAAELHRWQLLKSIKLRPRALRKWDPQVLKFTHDLGLFKLLDINNKYVSKMVKRIEATPQHQAALAFVTDCTSQKEQTDNLSTNLSEKVPAFDSVFGKSGDMKVSTALAEAALNSVNHAYEDDLKYKIPDKRWWAAASYEDSGSKIRFFVYDQGVGISKTLPNTETGKKILGLIPAELLKIMSNGAKIQKLLETPKSRTLLGNRGKGFLQMVEAAEFRSGRLRIVSGRGYVTYSKESGVLAEIDRGLHLGGTLLEWTFELGDYGQNHDQYCS